MVPTGQLLRGSANSGQVLDSYTLSNILLISSLLHKFLTMYSLSKSGIPHYLIRADQSAHSYTFSQFTIKEVEYCAVVRAALT